MRMKRQKAGLITHVDRWGRRVSPVAVLANFVFAFLWQRKGDRQVGSGSSVA